jgi:uncharacterized membrane protein YedE/YeeE
VIAYGVGLPLTLQTPDALVLPRTPGATGFGMENFTPISALIGGAMIGVAATLLLILNGRIAGISGVLGGLLPPRPTDVGWRMAFLLGLIVAPVVYAAAAGSLPRIEITASTGTLVVAGNFRWRRHAARSWLHERPRGVWRRPGLNSLDRRQRGLHGHGDHHAFRRPSRVGRLTLPIIMSAFAAGLIFGLGLVISQMINPAKVQAFLDIFGKWDASLAFVMAGAVAVSALGYRFAKRRGASILAGGLDLPTRHDLDARLISGAAIFGVGWGLVGFCPGPALAALGLGIWQTYVFVAAMLLGMLLIGLMPLGWLRPRSGLEPRTSDG